MALASHTNDQITLPGSTCGGPYPEPPPVCMNFDGNGVSHPLIEDLSWLNARLSRPAGSTLTSPSLYPSTGRPLFGIP